MRRSDSLLEALPRAHHALALAVVIPLAVGLVPLVATALFPATFSLVPAPGTYLAFHSVVEVFRVVVAFSIFGVGWYTHDLSRDRHALFLACAFLTIGLVDLAHALSYPGMPHFLTPNSTNKASQLWVAARFLSGVAFLGSAFVSPGKRGWWLRKRVLGIAALLTALAANGAVMLLGPQLPATFVPGLGQTSFKRWSEYLIVGLLLGAMAAHGRRYKRTREPSALIYVSGFAVSALSEVCFAFYRDVADPWNTLGHVYKAVAFYLVYRGMFISSVRRPHSALQDAAAALQREVATRAEAQAALDEERSRIAAIMEASPVGMARLDRYGRLAYLNTAAERMLGVRREEVTGLPLSERFRFTDAAGAPVSEADLCFSVIAQTRSPVRLRRGLERSEGGRVLLEVLGAPLCDAAGVFDGAVLIYEDVTERGQVEEQLRQTQKMEAIGRLAGGVAHDFNNLLTAILAASEHLLEVLPPDAPIREDAKEVRLAGERAAALTRQLLTFSRKQMVLPRVIPLHQLVIGLVPMLRRLIGDDVELEAHTGSVGCVRADPGQVEQVIVNLVVNARDAMPEGGRITLETEDIEIGPAEAREHLGVQPGPFVALTASDTGTGMDADVLSHVFEPFFTTKEPGKGTGLGLPAVYGIVKQAGGHVRVESTKGVGTVFRVFLPRVAAVEEQPASPGGAAAHPLSPATVLLVEDEPQVRSALLRTLRRAGHEVLDAADSEDALRRAADLAQRIDLVITDVVMPRLGGRDLAARIRKLRPGLKVLFVSGYVATAFSAGELDEDTAFLQKPFTPAALGEALAALLGRAEERTAATR